MNLIHDVELITIGALAKLASITADALRHYERLGLITPACISPETGYRYYTAAQADDLARIGALKAFGFPLAQIKEIMNQPGASAVITQLRTRYAELLQERNRITAAMALLAEEIKLYEEDSQ